jgi:D-glycero-D-manno-heptose 1,7-bisphosphate phosphatase
LIEIAKQRALFLDRDGTLIRDAHYLKDPQELEIIEVAGPALQKARNAGFLLFMHTNQSGIARGYYDWPDVYACNAKMHCDFGWADDFFAEVCIAPESPNETEGYRKPSSKFEEEMIKKYDLDSSQCWVIGDKWIDPETALNARMKGALVRTGKPIDQSLEEKAASHKVKIFKDLAEFIRVELKL